MMDEFLKLLKKKSDEQGGPMKGPRMDAKAAMAKELSDLLGGDMIDGMKKVTVASDSSEGLEKGLERAQEVLNSKSMKDESDEMDEESENMEDESEEMEDESEEESEDSEEMADVEDEIAKLEKQIAQLKKKKK